MERQSADLSTAAGSCRCYDSRRRAQRRRSAAVGAQCRGRKSRQSAYGSQGLPGTGRRAAGREQARARYVRKCRRAGSTPKGRTQKVSGGRMAQNRGKHSAARPETRRTAESGKPEVRGHRSEVRRGRQKEKRMTRFTQFFTLRRQGAKEEGTSKQQRFVGLSSGASISVPNLSGFATLREIAA